MGVCNQKQNQKSKNRDQLNALNPNLPNIALVSRVNSKILTIMGNFSQCKVFFNCGSPLHPDSAIGFLGQHQVLIGGGTNKSSKLVDDFMILYPILNKEVFLPRIPIKCRLGNFYEIDSQIFYVGGISISETGGENPLPLMIYNMTQESWTVQNTPRSSIGKLMRYIKYGSCLYKNKIYIVGGLRVRNNGKMKYNQSVLTIQTQNKVKLIKLQISCPKPLQFPICMASKDQLFITGGMVREQNKANTEVFQLSLDELQTKQHVSIPIPVLGNYPGIARKKIIILFDYPHILSLNIKQTHWRMFRIQNFNQRFSIVQIQRNRRNIFWNQGFSSSSSKKWTISTDTPFSGNPVSPKKMKTQPEEMNSVDFQDLRSFYNQEQVFDLNVSSIYPCIGSMDQDEPHRIKFMSDLSLNFYNELSNQTKFETNPIRMPIQEAESTKSQAQELQNVLKATNQEQKQKKDIYILVGARKCSQFLKIVSKVFKTSVQKTEGSLSLQKLLKISKSMLAGQSYSEKKLRQAVMLIYEKVVGKSISSVQIQSIIRSPNPSQNKGVSKRKIIETFKICLKSLKK